jgi:hypothetical protein
MIPPRDRRCFRVVILYSLGLQTKKSSSISCRIMCSYHATDNLLCPIVSLLNACTIIRVYWKQDVIIGHFRHIIRDRITVRIYVYFAKLSGLKCCYVSEFWI